MKIIFGLSKQKRSSPTLPRVCTAQTHKGENYAFSAFLCFCSIHTLARLLGVCKFIYSVLFLQGAVLSAVSKINPASFVSFPPFCPHQNILKVARKQGASPHPKKSKMSEVATLSPRWLKKDVVGKENFFNGLWRKICLRGSRQQVYRKRSFNIFLLLQLLLQFAWE